jgi:hypothetical protein
MVIVIGFPLYWTSVSSAICRFSPLFFLISHCVALTAKMNRLLASCYRSTASSSIKAYSSKPNRARFATQPKGDGKKPASSAPAASASSSSPLTKEWEELAKKEISFEPSKLTWITAEVD